MANAVDAMPAGGRVAPDARERMFQLFATTKATGTGVGLAVVKKIVERHGGRVTLDTTGGTRRAVRARGACHTHG